MDSKCSLIIIAVLLVSVLAYSYSLRYFDDNVEERLKNTVMLHKDFSLTKAIDAGLLMFDSATMYSEDGEAGMTFYRFKQKDSSGRNEVVNLPCILFNSKCFAGSGLVIDLD